MKTFPRAPCDPWGSHELEEALKRHQLDVFLAWYAGQKSPSDAEILSEKILGPIKKLKEWESDMRHKGVSDMRPRGWNPQDDLFGSIEHRSEPHERQEMRERYDDISCEIKQAAKYISVFSRNLRTRYSSAEKTVRNKEVRRLGRPAKDHSDLRDWIRRRTFIVPNQAKRALAKIIAEQLVAHNPQKVPKTGWCTIERVMRGCSVDWSGCPPRQAKVSWPQESQVSANVGTRKR